MWPGLILVTAGRFNPPALLNLLHLWFFRSPQSEARHQALASVVRLRAGGSNNFRAVACMSAFSKSP
jgi:hypothetical protein